MRASRALTICLGLALATPAAAQAAVRVTPAAAVPGAAVVVTPGATSVTIGGRRARVLTVGHGRARVVVPKLRPGRVAVVVGRGRRAQRGRMTVPPAFAGAIRTTPVAKAAARASIGPEGGTLTARHAGVSFVLTVPKGALAARTTIVMTPISAIRGLPLSGRAAAVRFGPEGLTFAVPATLSIRGVRGKLIGFTAAGSGARLAFLRARTVGNRAVVAIAHFSTAGAGSADAADFAAAIAPLISGLGPLTEGEIETLVGEIGLWQERFGPAFCETQPVCQQALDKAKQSLDQLIPQRCIALRQPEPTRPGVKVMLRLAALYASLGFGDSDAAVECASDMMRALVAAAITWLQADALADSGAENQLDAAELGAADADQDGAISRFEWLLRLSADAGIFGYGDVQAAAIAALEAAFQRMHDAGLDACETNRSAGRRQLTRGQRYARTIGDRDREADFARAIDACDVDVSVAPADVSIAAGATQQFAAQVTSRLDTSVTWTATAGAIAADGSYIAPAQPGTYLVRATSVANPRRSGTAIVRVACNDPSCQADVALDSRESEIFAAAHAHDSTTFETSDEKTFSGPGTFNDTVMREGGSSVCCSASGTGSQNSSVSTGPAGLSVNASGAVDGVESGGFDSAGLGRSEIVVRFTIGKSHHFSISGSQTVPARGQAVVKLSSIGVDVNGFNHSGTLPPGSYTLTVRFEATTLVSAQTEIPSSHGQFNVSLDVTV